MKKEHLKRASETFDLVRKEFEDHLNAYELAQPESTQELKGVDPVEAEESSPSEAEEEPPVETPN